MFKVYSLLALLLLLSCDGNHQTAGGSGTETEAVLSGIVRIPSGEAAASARILLRDGLSSTDKIYDSTRTDSQGRWELPGVPVGSWSLESQVRRGDSLWIQLHRVTVSTVNTHPTPIASQVQAGATLQGTLLQASGSPAPLGTVLAVMGRGDTAHTDALGNFTLESLPKGAHWLVVDDQIFPAHTGGNNVLQFASAQLVEDFEDDHADVATYPGRWSGAAGWWYALNNGTALAILPMIQPDLIEPTQHALHASFLVPAGDWALVGFKAGDTTAPDDWCSVQSLQLRARGSGTIQLNIQTLATLNAAVADRHFYYALTLDSSWQNFEIPMDSLHIVGAATAPSWSDACSQTIFVNFLAKDTTDLWLDDIRLKK